MRLTRLLAGGVLVLGVMSCTHAESADPTLSPPAPECGAAVYVDNDHDINVHLNGVVKSLTPSPDYPGRFTVTVTEPTTGAVAVTDGTSDHSFELFIVPALMPFKVGDKIGVEIRRSGGWHRVFDGRIKDASGRILLITSSSGADDWADGWKVHTGKVVQSEHNPNSKGKSEQRTHALDFARGATKLTVKPAQCLVAREGNDRYLIAGEGHSWLGSRPPEGVDYQNFSLIRW